jgi:hypothetical protein
MVDHVTSRDGTRIGYDRLGGGPPVVLVCGGSVDRLSNAGFGVEASAATPGPTPSSASSRTSPR